ncbi:cell division protein FtsQ/DivIB [Salinisphaera sp. T31B1]|uniref:cell division protein FtsQ/DivIB n=1 Tax=Salinisphaera sp. T31B1 TaxID=727963 RepID=UPI0033429DD0
MNAIRRIRANKRWRDGLLGALLLFGVAACTWQGIKPDDQRTGHLYISGTSSHVSDEQIAHVAAPYMNSPFFDVDLKGLQAELARQPWLAEVEVSRHWPDGVAVHITEQRPVALWGDEAVLGANGRVFVPDAASRPTGLVALDGPPTAGLKVYEQYRHLSELLAGHDTRIARLTLDARGSWTATLDDGLQLRLGRDDLDERMHRFVDYALARTQARDALAGAGYVDLRYSDGFAVGGTRAATPKDQEKVNEQAA